MTIKLDAIAESHPETMVAAFLQSLRIPYHVKREIEGDLFDQDDKSPFYIMDDVFWSDFVTKFERKVRDAQDDPENNGCYGYNGDLERVLDVCFQQWRCVREILEQEIEVIGSGKYKRVYSEGRDSRVVMSVVSCLGVPVMYLDTNNSFLQAVEERLDECDTAEEWNKYLASEEFLEGQKKREELWVQKIKPEEGGLIIAGFEHVVGKYGLDKRLLEKGMQLTVVASHTSQNQESDRLIDALEELAVAK